MFKIRNVILYSTIVKPENRERILFIHAYYHVFFFFTWSCNLCFSWWPLHLLITTSHCCVYTALYKFFFSNAVKTKIISIFRYQIRKRKEKGCDPLKRTNSIRVWYTWVYCVNVCIQYFYNICKRTSMMSMLDHYI